ncbi:Cytochrome P450, E-class, group I [Parasponia andersonii]|uniref:Cytochrome P450, E-class, group I n=1 Tax=Parasponia andersonii TaxID=3476 RepID=A0A2P5BYG2_PARAD|nr:Cytochrome P450, E-class, group I [Parasponia andersonii]
MVTTLTYDTTSLFFTLTTIFVFIWYAWMYIKAKNHRTTPLPAGPRGLPLVGNLLGLDPELYCYFAGLAHVYGPIFKLQLGSKLRIVVTSPPLGREVLKEKGVVFANRDVLDAIRNCIYGVNDVAWTPYGPEWWMLRKVCVSKMLSNTTLDSFYSLRRQEVGSGRVAPST